jgi:hypothetical protein
MFDKFSDGYCPQCLLDDERREMLLNSDDYWECPACHLQARGGSGMFVLLRTRGKGRLKTTKATDYVNGWVLCRADLNDQLKNGDSFKDLSDLRNFVFEIHHKIDVHKLGVKDPVLFQKLYDELMSFKPSAADNKDAGSKNTLQ